MIKENIRRVKDQIREAAEKANRHPDDIQLVAVSKRFPAEAINEAVAAGHFLFGENYIQEVDEKRQIVNPAAKFHFIGHLQSNKAKIAASCCDMIETVDSFKLGKELNKHLQKISKTLPILVQVNLGDEPQKSGTARDSVRKLIEDLNQLQYLHVKGVMTIPPFFTDPEESRPYFHQLNLLATELFSSGLFRDCPHPEVSMGMSNDFHIAIEEGATIVRVGTAIFGQRS